jgi:hypothetical protein
MDPVMSRAEIEAQFPDEWVLIEDPQTDQYRHVQGGRVLYHSKDRDELYRRAIALRPARAAILYTGTIPEGTGVLL